MTNAANRRNTTSIKIIQPACWNAFHCLGPDCSDNCCHSWEILIDKAHYHRYLKESLPEFRELCKKTVQKREQGRTPEQYAALALNADECCGFQDPDGGCRIYRLLGPDALSDTCAIYPRRKAQFLSDTWEFSMSLSCEEAARLALFSPGGMELETLCRSPLPGDPLDQAAPLGIGPDGRFTPPPVYGPILRQVCMELIQYKPLPIGERLLAIGLLLRKTDRLLLSGGAKQIAAMAVSFFLSVKQGDFSGFFDQLDYQKEAHLAALRLPVAHLLSGARKPVLRHLWDILVPWCDRDASGDYIAGRRAVTALLEEITKNADPLIRVHEQAVEHYFSNYLFSSMFPFLYHHRGLSFEKHGILLAEQFALLRILLAVYSDISDEKERLVRAVVTLSRLCQHADLGQDLELLIRHIGLDGLAHAAYLLRQTGPDGHCSRISGYTPMDS